MQFTSFDELAVFPGFGMYIFPFTVFIWVKLGFLYSFGFVFVVFLFEFCLFFFLRGKKAIQE